MDLNVERPTSTASSQHLGSLPLLLLGLHSPVVILGVCIRQTHPSTLFPWTHTSTAQVPTRWPTNPQYRRVLPNASAGALQTFETSVPASPRTSRP